jgi:hypothetical protein
MDEHRAIPDPTVNKLGGVHPRRPPRAQTQEGSTQTANVPYTENSQGSADQGWRTQPETQPGVDFEHWRQYATPAATPTRDDSQETDESIHVDIAPVEPGTEQSNWESFIHQLGDDT